MHKNFIILCALLIFQSCKQEPEIKISNQSTSPIDSVAIVPYGERKEIFISLSPGETKTYPLEQDKYFWQDDAYTISYLQNYKAKETHFGFSQYSVSVGGGNSAEDEYLITIELDTVKLNFSNPSN